MGESEYKLNCQLFRQHTPLWLRPAQSISQTVSFTFKQCAIVVIQAITLSSLAGMAREAQDIGTNTRSPEDYVGTSATLFAISLAQSALGVLAFVRATYNELAGSFLRASDDLVSKVKAEQTAGWNDKGQVEVLMDTVMGWFCVPPAKRYESKGRLRLGTAGALVPLLGGVAASGALIMSVAIGSAYHSVVRSIDIPSVAIADDGSSNDDTGFGAVSHSSRMVRGLSEGTTHGVGVGVGAAARIGSLASTGLAWVEAGASAIVSPAHSAIEPVAGAWSGSLVSGVRASGLDRAFVAGLQAAVPSFGKGWSEP